MFIIEVYISARTVTDTETPIYTHLLKYHRKNRIPFAMPGHKNLRALAPDLQLCDVTELAETVDLYNGDEVTNRANELLAERYKSRKSFILTGGSTLGIQVMLSSVLDRGDTLLASSDCHMSVINTCALCGFNIKFADVGFDGEFLVPSRKTDFEIADDIKAVLLTSPNYYGMVKDIRAAAEKCHSAGVPLIVDGAHGAHFIASDRLPCSAEELGADMVCLSAHKTLNALTGAAYLNVCGENIDLKRVKRAVSAFATSSPSYPIAASADIARAVSEKTDYTLIIDECEEFKNAIRRCTKIKFLDNDDLLRIVMCFSEYEISGFEVNAILSSYYGIDVEAADLLNIIMIVTPWNKHEDFTELFRALREITDGLNERKTIPRLEPPPVTDEVISPSEGWFAKTETVNINKAAHRRSVVNVSAYPPGCPIIVTGGIITREQTEYIAMLKSVNAHIIGLDDDRIEVVK